MPGQVASIIINHLFQAFSPHWRGVPCVGCDWASPTGGVCLHHQGVADSISVRASSRLSWPNLLGYVGLDSPSNGALGALNP
ncbi:hypothetical protein JYU34_007136 [Plutella xylostella]|uniref:Uncharacterized protein n=1 Tax=Plutella xylostella TaxID=51655 RepID=A0ABQ7QPN4_PLUXY|nr:hypothetical protein JYU34_007136 [Plutella xylostella]